MYNCISNEERTVVPPDVEVELFSKYRENYFRLLCHQPKAFNKKRGQFTNFADISKADRDRDSSMKQASAERKDSQKTF